MYFILYFNRNFSCTLNPSSITYLLACFDTNRPISFIQLLQHETVCFVWELADIKSNASFATCKMNCKRNASDETYKKDDSSKRGTTMLWRHDSSITDHLPQLLPAIAEQFRSRCLLPAADVNDAPCLSRQPVPPALLFLTHVTAA
jgi:hypothetical protein